MTKAQDATKDMLTSLEMLKVIILLQVESFKGSRLLSAKDVG